MLKFINYDTFWMLFHGVLVFCKTSGETLRQRANYTTYVIYMRLVFTDSRDKKTSVFKYQLFLFLETELLI